MGTFRQLLGFLWMFSHYLLANSDPTILCAHTGSSFSNDYERKGWANRNGPLTIGAKNFHSAYGGAMYSVFYGNGFYTSNLFKDGNGVEEPHCPYNYQPHNDAEYGRSVGSIELCDEKDERVTLRVNAVQQTDSAGIKHTLAGWLHLEVELTNKSDQIRMIYAQMYDEYYNAVGEFVMDPSEQCGASKNPNKYITPTSYQYLPCSAIGASEAKPSQAVYMVDKWDVCNHGVKRERNPAHFPSKDLTSVHGVHFTWRMNEYWCNRHYRITPMVFVLTTKEIQDWRMTTNGGYTKEDEEGTLDKLGHYRMLRKIPRHSLRSIWIGAADIKHTGRGPFDCSNPVINDQLYSPTDKDADWILEKLPFHVTWEYNHVKNIHHVTANIYGTRTCQLNPFPFGMESPAFGGRCKSYFSNDTSHAYLQSCNKDANSREFQGLNITFQTYGNYVIALHVNRSLFCKNPCRAPVDLQDALNMSSIIIVKGSIRTDHHITTGLRGRKYHGVLCIIVSMFLMPVSLFSARYYKETYMKLQHKGCHLWYWIHLGTSILSMALLFGSQTGLSNSLRSWGRSLDTFSIIHHSIGWLSHAGFVGMFILGGLRSLKVPLRKFLMTAHSILGFLHYFVNLFLICLSTMIPASPSLGDCDLDGLPMGISLIAEIVMLWALVDATFHGFLTVLMLRMDTRMEIRRGWYCPIIPILHPTSYNDMRGALLRKILFLMYIVLSGAFTLGTVLRLTLREQPRGCIFGETTCKGALGCSAYGIAMCKKLQYADCE